MPREGGENGEALNTLPKHSTGNKVHCRREGMIDGKKIGKTNQNPKTDTSAETNTKEKRKGHSQSKHSADDGKGKREKRTEKEIRNEVNTPVQIQASSEICYRYNEYRQGCLDDVIATKEAKRGGWARRSDVQ